MTVSLIDESDLHKWTITMDGPPGSPYAVCKKISTSAVYPSQESATTYVREAPQHSHLSCLIRRKTTGRYPVKDLHLLCLIICFTSSSVLFIRIAYPKLQVDVQHHHFYALSHYYLYIDSHSPIGWHIHSPPHSSNRLSFQTTHRQLRHENLPPKH